MPSSAAEYSDRLTDIDRSLTVNGYQAQLASKDHLATKSFEDGSSFSVMLWMKSPAGKRLRDARQVKFTQSYCASPSFSQARFFTLAQSERTAFFRKVIGQAPLARLDTDLPTLGYEAKTYPAPHFRKVRLAHRPMKCDGRGGEAYELDLFP